jgi:methionyl-tRNA formyltransferase
LFYGEKELGVTVQLISDGIDCGIPVFEISIPIQPDDLMRDLDNKVEIQTPPMMAMAIKRLMTESSQPSPLNSYGKLYTVPTFGQWFIYQSYMFRRRLLKFLF